MRALIALLLVLAGCAAPAPSPISDGGAPDGTVRVYGNSGPEPFQPKFVLAAPDASTVKAVEWLPDGGVLWGVPAGGGASSPTGTGVALVSGGSFVGAAGPVNLSSSTYVTNNLPIANGGTGAAMTCASGNLVQASSSTVLTCNAMSGDTTISSSGVTTTSSLQSGEITAGATTATLTAASGATAPGLAQAAPASDVALHNTTVAAQGAFATATTNTQGASVIIAPGSGSTASNLDGNVDVKMPQANTAIGTSGALRMFLNGTQNFQVWGYNGLTTGVWLGPNSNYGSLASVALYSDGTSTQINGTSNVIIEYAGNDRLHADANGTWIYQNTNFGVNGTPVAGGGVGVLSISNTSTPPTGACTGGTCLDSVALVAGAGSGLTATSASFDVDTIQPVTGGTHASQVNKYPQFRWQDSATTSHSPNFAMTIPTGSVCDLDYIAEVRCTNALGSCNTSGVGSASIFHAIGYAVKNISGTAAILSAVGTPTLNVVGDNVGSLGCALAASTSTITFTCGHQSDAQTSDWTMRTWLNCN